MFPYVIISIFIVLTFRLCAAIENKGENLTMQEKDKELKKLRTEISVARAQNEQCQRVIKNQQRDMEELQARYNALFGRINGREGEILT